MSATLGALVIAISTEFSGAADRALPRGARGRARAARRAAAHLRVDRRGGASPRARPRSPASRCSRSPTCRMLRDFGRVTVVDLSVSLLGVLAVLPAVLMLAERRAAGPPLAAAGVGGGGGARRSRHERARREPAAGGDLALHLDRRRGRRAGARLHHAQHARRPTSRARAACRTASSCRRSRSRSRRRSSYGDAQVDPSKACKVRGRGHPQLVPAGRARPGRARRSSPPAPSAASDQVDVLERVRRRFPDVGFAAVSVRGDRGDVRRLVREARLGDAGRLRPRRRGLQRLRGGDLPDDHVRARRREVADTSFSLLGRGGAGARARRGAAVTLDRSPEIAGRVPRAAPPRAHARRRAPAPQPAGAARAAAGALRPLPRRAGDRAAPPAGAARLPRLLPPHRARPRRAPHAGRGARARAAEDRRLRLALGARRRADDRGDGDRRAGVGARRRPRRGRARAAPGASAASASAAASTRATCRPGGWWWPTTRGRSACCSARWRRGAASSARDDADDAARAAGRRGARHPRRGGAVVGVGSPRLAGG